MSDKDGSDGSLESLTTIFKGAGLFLVGKVVSRVFGLLTNLVLTRFLGASLYGIYAYLNVIFGLITVFTRLGGDKSVMRFLPEYSDQPRKRQAMLTLAYGTTLGASVLVAIAIYVFAPLISTLTLDDPLLVQVLRITAIVIPFNTLSMITYSVFKGIERMDYNVAVSSVVSPVLRLVFVGGAVALGYSLIGAAAGLIVSGFLTMIVAFVVLLRKTETGSVSRPTRSEAKQYYDFSVPLTFTQLGSFLYNRIDVLMIGFFLSGSAVGIYNITVLLSRVLSLPLTAFNQLFPPIASDLYHAGQHERLQSIYASVTRLILTAALFPAIAMFVYAPELLGLFGEDFAKGESVLVLFIFAQVTNAMVGPSGYLLMMSDHQYLTMINQVGSGILNATLNYVLILRFGFIGAALATASVLSAINLLRLIEVWYLEGLSPYDTTYLKPVAAGIASGVAMTAVSFSLEQFRLIVVGGSIGAIVYLSGLYLLGIDDGDIELMRNVIN
jgi:O-antigen/teichoic acid export membrane protein